MPTPIQHTVPILSENLFPVVGVGASAGGLDAFRQLVQAIPADNRMAWILVQHLSPRPESLLPDILQKYTPLPVLEVTDDLEVMPGHIYTIPSNKVLTANGGMLQLFNRNAGEHPATIDLFLTSLAEIHREQAIGVLLSGTGHDGTVGLKMIRDVGGITIVQDKTSAAYHDMCQSAIDAEVVSFILAPADIPDKLLELVQAEFTDEIDSTEDKKQSELYRQILTLLHSRQGVDFSYYKQSTIRRRITRRMALQHVPGLHQYHALLIDNKSEQEALYRDILIPVTAFFRDPDAFDTLSKDVLPRLLQRKSQEEPLRLWVAGCSSGEEAYSLAILVQEYFGDHVPAGKVQIFATDLSEPAINLARNGKYPKKSLAGISAQRLQQYFTRLDGHYVVNKAIREMCVFAQQNFLKDPPFSRMDLITCRNVLIYLGAPLQKRALTTFHYALNPGGYLLLGQSESTGPCAELFQPFEGSLKLYTRNNIRSSYLMPPLRPTERIIPVAPVTSIRQTDQLTRDTDQALLAAQDIHGVVVDGKGNIVQFRGSTGPYLEPAPGKATYQVLRMAKAGLGQELRTLLHNASRDNKPIIKSGVQLDDGARKVDLLIVPLVHAEQQYYFIRFTDAARLNEPVEGADTGEDDNIPEVKRLRKRVTHLEKALAQARIDMRSVTDNQEAVNEELQSVNEELLSGSEELQSINEELQTTKEEVQSSNEELSILNQELLNRNDQLVHARQYMEALLNTIHEPLVVLSADLLIRRVNPAFYEWFGGHQQTVENYHFFDLNPTEWNMKELQEKLEAVLPLHTAFENFEISWRHAEKHRTLLVNARQVPREPGQEALILLAMRDVTAERREEELQRTFGHQMEHQVIQRTAELHHSNILLRQSNNQLEQYASIASHDLQEPLRKLRTFTAILSRKFASGLSAEANLVVAKIARTAERMSQLISEVLAYSRVLHARESFVQTNLHEILQNVMDDLSLRITETNAQVNYDNLLPTIEANPMLINQLFYNLLTNALKFFREYTVPQITITHQFVQKGTLVEGIEEPVPCHMLRIVVEDKGIGFQQEYAQQIFELFERLHGDEQFQGTGIGLALCKQIVRHHHGYLFARSTEGEGAQFHILLPITQSE